MKKISLKFQLIAFLGLFMLCCAVTAHDVSLIWKSALAVMTCALGDMVAAYLKTRKRTMPESALITGFIIGLVLSSASPWFFFVAAGLIALLSKHLLRIHGKHIFNPAAFGIFMIVLFCGQPTAWQGGYLWYILVPAGGYFVWRIRKGAVVYSYAIAYIILYGVRAWSGHTSFMNDIVYANYFFIFIMLIEPKTSPVTRWKKWFFGAAVCSIAFIFYGMALPYDALLPALLIGNLFFQLPLIRKEMPWTKK